MSDTHEAHKRNIKLLKATHWELAKGHLRAIIAAAGQSTEHLPYSERDTRYEYEVIEEDVEAFIREFERNEFNA